MIYLDNSATTSFKPKCVKNAVISAIDNLSANAGRSGHRKSVCAATLIYRTRRKLADFAGCDGDVVFTENCTEALNLAILGSIARGSHVITTVYEHNSVLRPLFESENAGKISVSVVRPNSDGIIDFAQIKPLLRSDTRLIAVNHVSNVTGATADIHGIGKAVENTNIRLLVDGAQSVGYIPVDMKKSNISYLAIAPHKGLHSIQGAGALCIAKGLKLRPIKFGGTGTQSLSVLQPEDAPECYESGTLPLPAIAATNRAIDYTEKNFAFNAEVVSELCKRLIRGLSAVDGVRILSRENPSGIVALNVGALSSEAVCDCLDKDYEIAARGGLHCAPLVHKYLGTVLSGAVRLSVGCDNTEKEIDEVIRAIKEIAAAVVS